MNKNEWMTPDEMRFLRRDIIQKHIWILKRDYPWQFENSYNLRLVVRLYEIQFYMMELKRYYYYEYHH
jgi:hypothetical protein